MINWLESLSRCTLFALCLFSALSCRVGTLEMSIMINVLLLNVYYTVSQILQQLSCLIILSTFLFLMWTNNNNMGIHTCQKSKVYIKQTPEPSHHHRRQLTSCREQFRSRIALRLPFQCRSWKTVMSSWNSSIERPLLASNMNLNAPIPVLGSSMSAELPCQIT